MGVSKLQLSLVGAQDFHLSANPQITHFKSVFRRYSNFSIDYNKIYFTGENTPNFGGNSRATIKPDGDLLGKLYLEVTISAKSSTNGAYTVNHFGNSLIKKVDLKIGGNVIDTLHSQWLQIYHELNHFTDDRQTTSGIQGGRFTDLNFTSDIGATKIDINDRLYGNMPLVFGGSIKNNNSSLSKPINTTYTKKIFIPLPFWFTKTSGMYLPLCAINNHSIELEFEFEEAYKLNGDSSNITDLKINKMELYGEFVHLGEKEKMRFTQTNHEYVIEQHQLNQNSFLNTSSVISEINTELVKTRYNLELNHPIKYISWAIVNEGSVSELSSSNMGQGPCYFVSMCSNSIYGNDGNDGKVRILFNGEDKEPELPMAYYTRLFPKKYLNNIPKLDRIGMYSFALNPMSIEPSGTCNFSKLQNAALDLTLANNIIETIKGKKLYIFAVNYNLLIITNGMAGLRYSS